jgi:YesN/AraC family two-component response regulator
VEDLYHIAFIFNHEPDDLETVKKMVSFLNNIVLMNYSIPCQIGIGTPKKNIMLINKSFQEASNVLKYAELYPKKKYFYFQDISLLDSRSIKFEKINNIKDYINLCDVSSFADLLNNLNNYIQKREMSYESYKEIIETIVFLFERTLKEIGFTEKTILKKSIREIINENYYVNDVFQAFKDIMRIIVEYQKDLNSHKGREYINKAKEFIAENLDKDISLNMIAEELNLSSSYISKLFKDITNVKFLSYVTRLRMEKAKELLTEGGMLVHTVAGKVGFHNYSYFSKMFKKYYGQLPGVYRRKH